MIRATHNNFTIEVFNDSLYNVDSKDNNHRYDIIYGLDGKSPHHFTSLHGIKIYNVTDNLLRTVAVCATGGSTRIHKNSFVIDNNNLMVCCCDFVFCLQIPSLNMLWHNVYDSCTCFEITMHNKNFFIHGEESITKINAQGEVLWQFSGKDIFVDLQGDSLLKIKDGKVLVSDFDGDEYLIDIETGEGELIKA